jgi:hypothetical protein
MAFDIRLPMGLLFTTLGLLLAIYGAVSNPEIYKASLGINVNLIWGLALTAFGYMMLLLAHRAHLRLRPSTDTGTTPRVQPV